MKILVLANTALAGSPACLAKCISKYTEHTATSVLGRLFTNPALQDLSWPYNFVTNDTLFIEELARRSDVVLHNQRERPISVDVPQFMLYHAEPKGHIPYESQAKFNGKKMVVAQYQARFYTDAVPVPNIIDIWDPDFMPAKRHTDTVTIFMGVASETNTGWGRKGSKEIQIMFDQLIKMYGQKVTPIFMQGRPMDEVCKVKRLADIVIDECVTGSYHRSSLEGLSYGAVTFNNIDVECENILKRVTGSDILPFKKANMRNLLGELIQYIENRDLLEAEQVKARQWAETYWDPKVQVNNYLDFILRE